MARLSVGLLSVMPPSSLPPFELPERFQDACAFAARHPGRSAEQGARKRAGLIASVPLAGSENPSRGPGNPADDILCDRGSKSIEARMGKDLNA